MSIVATNWAMRQRPDGPSAQIVLFVIADRANERGVCRHADPDDIADISRQSRATVFRRLDELERVGLLTRFLRHGQKGEREYEIRLNLEAVVDYSIVQERDTGRRVIRLRDGGEATRDIVLRGGDSERDDQSEGQSGDQSEQGSERGDERVESQIETQDESQIETQRVSPVRLGESHSCDSHKNPSKSPLPTPKAPSLGPRLQGGREETEPEAPGDDTLDRFRAVYPQSTNRPAEVSRLWAALTDAERSSAIEGARGLAEQRKRNPKQAVLDPARYLRDPALWAEHARFAPVAPPPSEWVAVGTPEWAGRTVLATIRRSAMPRAGRNEQHGGEGAFLRALPADRVLALARLAEVAADAWVIVAEGSRQWIAWQEWVAPLGARLTAERERVPGEWVTFQTPSGPREAPRRIMGARVPSEWPPALRERGARGDDDTAGIEAEAR